METELGTRVFDRQPRGVALTEDGRVLLPYAEAVLDRLTAGRRALDELRGLGRGRLRVGAFPTAVAALVPQALASFRAAYPGVELSLVEGMTPTLLERLADGDADVTVVSAPPTATLDESRFELLHLLDERLLVAVSREHRLARRRTVRLAELADDAFITGSATAENALLRASLPAGFQPRVDIVAAEWTGKLGCVAAGLGVALVPALAIRGTPADIALLRLHADDEGLRRLRRHGQGSHATADRGSLPDLSRARRGAAGFECPQGSLGGHRPVTQRPVDQGRASRSIRAGRPGAQGRLRTVGDVQLVQYRET